MIGFIFFTALLWMFGALAGIAVHRHEYGIALVFAIVYVALVNWAWRVGTSGSEGER